MTDDHGDIFDDDLLRRYVMGELDASARSAIELRLAADPAAAESVARLSRAWEATRTPPFEVTTVETADALARLRARLRERAALHDDGRRDRSVSAPGDHPRRPPNKHRAPGWVPGGMRRWAVAATVLLFGASALSLAFGDRSFWRHLVGAPEPRARVAAAPMREWITHRGEQAKLTLADGSIMTVAPESRVRVRTTLGARADSVRDVYLEGEAYFVVRHDAARPFRVHHAGTVTEDIGTAFVVTAYPDTRGSRVVVTEGSIRLQPDADASSERPAEITLSRGDVARVRVGGETRVTHSDDPDRYVAWTRGLLLLDGIRLADAVPVLERWYDVDIALADPKLADVRVTLELRVESSERMVDRLEQAIGVHARVAGRAVTLLPKR